MKKLNNKCLPTDDLILNEFRLTIRYTDERLYDLDLPNWLTCNWFTDFWTVFNLANCLICNCGLTSDLLNTGPGWHTAFTSLWNVNF